VPERTIPVALARMETREQLAAFYARVRDRLFATMRPDARATVIRRFESYLEDPRNFDWAPVPRHGDFGGSNILFEPESGQVSGVIDFSGIAWGDPAYDVAGLLACYGEGFLAQAARTYPEIDGHTARARFYRATFALEEALFGCEHGDEAAFNAGMACYT
jgi:aminoglycoside 2''-phosphotransferase